MSHNHSLQITIKLIVIFDLMSCYTHENINFIMIWFRSKNKRLFPPEICLFNLCLR